MTGTVKDLIEYRLNRAKDTLDDAYILAENSKWNSTINRLYYAAYYAVTALLLKSDLRTDTHNGVKSNFSEHFIKTKVISKDLGKIYHNSLHGVKRVITMIYSISRRIRSCLILSL